ncbi:hypothetical protein ACG7TL_003979 [Trametes sanguinea]
MLNIGGNMHGGCAVYLIDVCSSMALAVLGMATNKPWNFVSQAINTTFHAPAPPGVKIEIANTTVSFGSRTVTAITEVSTLSHCLIISSPQLTCFSSALQIWDTTNNRLCVTGTHNKMKPSEPKTKL